MTVNLVQQSGHVGSAENESSPVSATFPGTTTTGNALLCIGLMFNQAGVALTSITDDSSGEVNTWTFSTTPGNQNPPFVQQTDGSAHQIALFAGWCLNAAPVNNVTVAFNAGDPVASFTRWAIGELSGVFSADSAASASGDSTPPYRTTLALTDSGDFVAAAADDFNQAIVAPAGFDAFTATGQSISFALPGTTGSFNVDYSSGNPGATDFWATVSVAFSPHVSGPAIQVSPSSATVPQDGSAQFALSLSSAPGADVTVNTAFASGNSGLSVTAGGSLTFTTVNWATPQDVTITADATSTGAATFTSSATDCTPANFTATETIASRPIRAGLLAIFP